MGLARNDQRFAEEVSQFISSAQRELMLTTEENSLGIQRQIAGVVYPESMEQLRKLVQLASRHGVPLYPVSQGKNIGYGDRTPYQQGQVVVSLTKLNKIREYNPENGEVVVEPGVTQGQLAQFLKDRGAPYWADVTGASPDASILGNTLEAGFGHTPIGDHRKNILDMEVILTDGSLLRTGEMPSVGPDLATLFIQSNFGLVTAIKIPLFPIPEDTVTFVISFSTEPSFFKGIGVLKELRKAGVFNSLVHSGNATRALMTASPFPKECDPAHALSESECQAMINTKGLLKVGAWTTIGAIYGMKEEVKFKEKRLKAAFRGVGQVRVFTDRKIRWTDLLLNSKILKKFPSLNLARKSFASLKALHGILRGQPSSVPSENIYWRVKEQSRLGLAWFSPVIPATAQDAEKLLTLSRALFAKYGLEMPVTLTMINDRKMTAVFNICFDKSRPSEVALAHQAYQELSREVKTLGYGPYRLGILSDCEQAFESRKLNFLNVIKRALDPRHIMAPGRYGIGAVKQLKQRMPQIESRAEKTA
ncbi:MAG: FAD-binding oxidoreductase [Bdellovibrionaceae bacterium]|nr:FAD-binding oxidoreductase [Pseudobdellovibrionaceae bacterium]